MPGRTAAPARRDRPAHRRPTDLGQGGQPRRPLASIDLPAVLAAFSGDDDLGFTDAAEVVNGDAAASPEPEPQYRLVRPYVVTPWDTIQQADDTAELPVLAAADPLTDPNWTADDQPAALLPGPVPTYHVDANPTAILDVRSIRQAHAGGFDYERDERPVLAAPRPRGAAPRSNAW